MGFGLYRFLAGLSRWNRPDTPQYNAVTYSNLMLLWLFITFCSMGWQLTKHPRLEKSVKALTVIVVFAGFVLTQTRTGWMAIPLFLFVAMWLFGHLRHPFRAFGLLVAGVAILVAIGSTIKPCAPALSKASTNFKHAKAPTPQRTPPSVSGCSCGGPRAK